MALQFKDGYITSLYGRRLGLQTLSSGQSGSTTYVPGKSPPPEFLIGPDALRQEVSTVATNSIHVQLNPGTSGNVAVLTSEGSTMSVFSSTAGIAVSVELLALNSTQWTMTQFMSTALINQTTLVPA